jgi:GTP-binding protein Era
MKSGTILLLGATNSGKSTLVNQIVGKRVSMVSRKKQSTTFNQKAVKNISETEFILQDTPGIYSAKTKISNKMTNTAFSAIDEANLVLVVVDSGSTKNSEIDKIIKTLNESNQSSKLFLVLNKIDKVSRETVLEKIKTLGDMNLFEEIFSISALMGDGVQEMLDIIKNYLPKGEKQFSNKKTLFVKKDVYYTEVTREKLYDRTHKEIPYECKITTDKVSNSKSAITIHQTIHINKKSHKYILVGNKGSNLKSIGESSRKEISKFMNKKVNLFLFVKLTSVNKS